MVTKILKWLGGILVTVLVILAAFYAFIYFNINSRINKKYDVKLTSLQITSDSIALAKGEHIAEIRGCKGCHGVDLSGGRAFADENSPIGVLYSTNITSGKGGIQYTDADWIRALRHGLGKDNRSLWFMPSEEIYQLSDQDMGYLVGYITSRPSVDKTSPQKSIKPLGRILTFLGQFPLFPAEKIDHNAVAVTKVTPSITPEYGQYLAITCTGCHATNYKGGPGHGPDEPPIPDISASGHVGKWTSAQFATAIRTGKTPEGKQLSDAMPWKELTFTDQELEAVYTYLHGLH